MTLTARPWLPEGALLHPKVRSAFRAIVADWSAHWFAQTQMRASHFIEQRSVAAEEARDWRPLPGLARVACPSIEGQWLVERVLQAPFTAPPATPADGQVLDAVLERMLLDLQASLDKMFEAPPGSSGQSEDYLEVAITDDAGSERLWVGVSADRLAVWLNNRLPRKPVSGKLGHLGDVLNKQPVNVEARLGNASLSLDDLTTLKPGDVVVLDHALEEPIHLMAPGGALPFSYAKLTDINGDRALVLTQAAQKE